MDGASKQSFRSAGPVGSDDDDMISSCPSSTSSSSAGRRPARHLSVIDVRSLFSLRSKTGMLMDDECQLDRRFNERNSQRKLVSRHSVVRE